MSSVRNYPRRFVYPRARAIVISIGLALLVLLILNFVLGVDTTDRPLLCVAIGLGSGFYSGMLSRRMEEKRDHLLRESEVLKERKDA